MFLIGFVLLPTLLASVYHLPLIFSNAGKNVFSFLPLLLGIGAYAFFEFCFSRPMRTYVFGHELTHALAAILTGGKVHDFQVSKDGGHVKVSDSNFFVALAPYFIPIYTLVILLAYFIAGHWLPVDQYHAIFLGAIGFSLAFHGSLTVHAIAQGQPDLKTTGFFFSIILILLINVWMLSGILKILFSDAIALRLFAEAVFTTQLAIWQRAGSVVFRLGQSKIQA